MAGKRRAATGGADKLERGLANAIGVCRCSAYGAAVCAFLTLMWIAFAVLWIGGSYIAKDAKAPGAVPCVGKANISIGLGKNSFVWWASSSGIIIIVTLVATCLYCCCSACMFSSIFSRVIKYVAAAGLVLSLLGFGVLIAWMGLGTYMATLVVKVNGQTCINYFILLIFFFVYLASLFVFCFVSAVWKLHDVAVNREKKSAGAAAAAEGGKSGGTMLNGSM